MSITGWVILAIIIVLALWAITAYNGLVAMRQRVSQALADIGVQLKQRHDLVPNLVETVKGYAAHERGTLEAVVNARNAAVTAQGPTAQAVAENVLSGVLRQLFALSESYPNLKANSNFQELQRALSDLENKIAASHASSTTPSRNTIRRFRNFQRRCSRRVSGFNRVSILRPMKTARRWNRPRR